MKPSQDIKYILYARKSTEGEDRQVQSIDAQMDVLKSLAERTNLNIVIELQESKSAKAPFQRPQFAKMLDMINSGQANGILCWELNRLSRNPAESGMLQQLLQDEKILRIQTHDRSHEPDDNAVVFSVESSISNQFIRDLSKNVKRGIAHKIRSGELSGPAPEGYLNVQNRHEKFVQVDPERFPLIRKAFDLFLTGNYTAPEILRILNEDWGYITVRHTKVGGNPMSRSTLYNVFRNPRYTGKIPDPYIEGKMIDANFPAMITVDEYDQVQELLGKRGCTRLATKHKFELRGFIRCGECGCMITAQTKKKKLNSGKVNYHTYYHCTRKKPCNQRGGTKEQDLFNQLYELLDGYELSPKLYEWGMQALNEIAKEEIMQRDDVQAMQFESVANIQRKLDRLLDMATDGYITPDVFKERSEKLTNELKNRQKEQAKTADRVKNWYEIVGHTLEVLTNANEKFVAGDLRDKQEVLMAIGENPVLIDGKLGITSNEWLLPIKNEVKNLRTQLDEVRTMPDKIQKASEEAILNTWCPGVDSNH